MGLRSVQSIGVGEGVEPVEWAGEAHLKHPVAILQAELLAEHAPGDPRILRLRFGVHDEK